MDKALRTTLMVLGILVLAVLLFNFGAQLYFMLSAPAAAGYGYGYGGMMGPMMRGGWGGMHPFGGFGIPFLGPILGLGLLVLLVAGIIALARGGRSQ